MSTILFRNATVISVDSTIGTVENCDVLIKDGMIYKVAPKIPVLTHGQIEIIDATNCLISPGLVDTHHHLWQQLLRFFCADWSAADYVYNVRNLYGSLFNPEDVYAANCSAALDLINNGITTVIDHCHILNSPTHADAAIQRLKDAGVRGIWCYGLYENPAVLTSWASTVLSPHHRAFTARRGC
jgi:cytosine/adenosine deaminase-related metal-dependent hydrolase